MSTNFSKNAINMSEVPATKVDAPTTSKDVKLFQENGEFKVKDFSGKVSPLVPPQQEVKIASVEVNTNEDANSYTLVIPSPNAKLAALEKTLVALVEQTKGDLQLSITKALATIQSWKDSQELANGVMDSSISEIEDKVSEIDKVLAGKTDALDFSNLQADLATIVGNINNTLATKKQLETAIREVKAELHEPAKVVAGTPNVKVETAGQTFTISVDVQEKVTETVIKEIARGGSGVSRKWVQEYVDSEIAAITGGGTVTTITSVDGSVGITPIDGGYDLAIISGGISNLSDLADVALTDVQNGQTLKYLNGNWVNSPDISGGVNQKLTSIDGSITVTEVSGGYDISSNVIAGDVLCDGVNSSFQINHRPIDIRADFPFVSLDSSSIILPHRVYDRTESKFNVEFSGVPSATSKILWHIHTFTSAFIPMRLTVDTTKTSSGSTASDHFKLPLSASGSYNFTVDWGDGQVSTITSWNAAAADHTYAASGVYTVSILGECTIWSFNNTGDRLKVLNVMQWGNAVTTALDFYGCTNLTDISAIDSPASRSLANLFRGCTGLNVDLSHWDVSKVTNMYGMFQLATAFNNGANTDVNPITGRTGIDGWDVGNVTSMGDMFNGASTFNRPTGNWNVGKVTNMVSMFKQSPFNQYIGDWNTVSVTNMGYMFNDCPFNQYIGDWNVSNCTGFQGFLSNVGVSTFNQDLSKWNVGKCVDFQYMFRRCYAFNNGANANTNPVTGRTGIDGWNIGSNTAGPINMQNMFWSNVSNMGFNRPIGNWDVSKVTNIAGMFRLCTSFNQDLSAWNTALVTNMFEAFHSCSALKQNFGPWNVSAVTNLSNMFTSCNLNDTGTTNYDALLVGWASRPVVASRSFSAGTSKYGAGAVASRAVLTGAPNLWTISDGGAI